MASYNLTHSTQMCTLGTLHYAYVVNHIINIHSDCKQHGFNIEASMFEIGKFEVDSDDIPLVEMLKLQVSTGLVDAHQTQWLTHASGIGCGGNPGR